MRKRYHTHHEWLHGRVVGLIGRQLLVKAEDRAAAFWEMAIDGIDEARLKKALTNLFGKAEGEKLLRLGRSKQVKQMAKAEVRRLVRRFEEKVAEIVQGPEDRLEATCLELEEHPYSEAVTLHEGNETFHKVDGLICFTGRVTAYHKAGTETTVSIFARWISHPFWQYSFSVS